MLSLWDIMLCVCQSHACVVTMLFKQVALTEQNGPFMHHADSLDMTMDRLLTCIWVWALVCQADAHSCNNERRATEPVGANVTFMCCTDMQSAVNWRYTQLENSAPLDVVEEGSIVNERYEGRVTASISNSSGPTVYNITVHNVIVNDSGRYICGEKLNLGTKHVNILTVYTTVTGFSASLGENVSFPCYTKKPDSVGWQFFEVGADVPVPVYNLSTVQEKYQKKFLSHFSRSASGVYQKLTLLTAQLNDSGLYVCAGEGDLGDKHAYVLTVTVPDVAADSTNYDPSAIGIAVGVAVFVVLVAIVVSVFAWKKKWCRKRAVRYIPVNDTDLPNSAAIDYVADDLKSYMYCDMDLLEMLQKRRVLSMADKSAIINGDASKRVEDLLKYIRSDQKTDEQRQLFLKCLEMNGQKHVVNFIRNGGVEDKAKFGDMWPLGKQQQSAILTNTPVLAKVISLDCNSCLCVPSDVVSHLYRNGCLSARQKADIVDIVDTRARIQKLLQIMSRKSVADWKKFVKIVNQLDISPLLTESVVAAEVDVEIQREPPTEGVGNVDVEAEIISRFQDLSPEQKALLVPRMFKELLQSGSQSQLTIFLQQQNSIGVFFCCNRLGILMRIEQLSNDQRLTVLLQKFFKELMTDCGELVLSRTTLDADQFNRCCEHLRRFPADDIQPQPEVVQRQAPVIDAVQPAIVQELQPSPSSGGNAEPQTSQEVIDSTIKKLSSSLKEYVDCCFQFITELRGCNLLTQSEFERVGYIAEVLNSDRNEYLLKILEMKPEADCESLMLALDRTEQKHVANYVRHKGSYNANCHQDWPLSELQLSRLDTNRTKLSQLVKLEDALIDQLRTKKCLTERQATQVKGIVNDQDRRQFLFFNILRRRSVAHLNTFSSTVDQPKVEELLFRDVVALDVRAKLDKAKLENMTVEEAEKRIEENPERVTSAFVNYAAPRSKPEDEFLNFFRTNDISVKACKGGSVDMLFFCRSIESVNVASEMYEKGQLKTIIENVFKEVLQTEKNVGLTSVVFDSELESCKSYFKQLKGVGWSRDLEGELIRKKCFMSYNQWHAARTKDWRSILRRKCAALPKRITVDAYFYNELSALCDKWCNRRLVEYCRSKGSNYDQVTALLESLAKRPDEDFFGFCIALYNSHQLPVVVELLTPEVPEEEPPPPAAHVSTRTNLPVSFDWKSLITSNYVDLLAAIDPDSQLLHHLLMKNVITAYNREQFEAPLRKNRRSRVDALLLYMLRRPDQDFVSFCESLKQTGQGHVVDELLTPGGKKRTDGSSRSAPITAPDGDDDVGAVKSIDKWRDLLRRNRSKLVDELELDDSVLHELNCFRVVNDFMYEHLQEETNPFRKNEQLLDHLNRRPPVDFQRFCTVLKKNNQGHVVRSYLS